MSASFALTLQHEAHEVVLEVTDGLVVITEDGKSRRRDYRDPELASVVFETNLDHFVRRGFAEVRSESASDIAALLEIFEQDDEEEVAWIRTENGRVVAAGFDATDLVSTEDFALAKLSTRKPFVGFAAEHMKLDHEVRHALRRLFAHPALELQELEVWIDLARPEILEMIAASPHAGVLHRLGVLHNRADGAPVALPLHLGQSFPNLRGFYAGDLAVPVVDLDALPAGCVVGPLTR